MSFWHVCLRSFLFLGAHSATGKVLFSWLSAYLGVGATFGSSAAC